MHTVLTTITHCPAVMIQMYPFNAFKCFILNLLFSSFHDFVWLQWYSTDIQQLKAPYCNQQKDQKYSEHSAQISGTSLSLLTSNIRISIWKNTKKKQQMITSLNQCCYSTHTIIMLTVLLFHCIIFPTSKQTYISQKHNLRNLNNYSWCSFINSTANCLQSIWTSLKHNTDHGNFSRIYRH